MSQTKPLFPLEEPVNRTSVQSLCSLIANLDADELEALEAELDNGPETPLIDTAIIRLSCHLRSMQPKIWEIEHKYIMAIEKLSSGSDEISEADPIQKSENEGDKRNGGLDYSGPAEKKSEESEVH